MTPAEALAAPADLLDVRTFAARVTFTVAGVALPEMDPETARIVEPHLRVALRAALTAERRAGLEQAAEYLRKEAPQYTDETCGAIRSLAVAVQVLAGGPRAPAPAPAPETCDECGIPGAAQVLTRSRGNLCLDSEACAARVARDGSRAGARGSLWTTTAGGPPLDVQVDPTVTAEDVAREVAGLTWPRPAEPAAPPPTDGARTCPVTGDDIPVRDGRDVSRRALPVGCPECREHGRDHDGTPCDRCGGRGYLRTAEPPPEGGGGADGDECDDMWTQARAAEMAPPPPPMVWVVLDGDDVHYAQPSKASAEQAMREHVTGCRIVEYVPASLLAAAREERDFLVRGLRARLETERAEHEREVARLTRAHLDELAEAADGLERAVNVAEAAEARATAAERGIAELQERDVERQRVADELRARVAELTRERDSNASRCMAALRAHAALETDRDRLAAELRAVREACAPLLTVLPVHGWMPAVGKVVTLTMPAATWEALEATLRPAAGTATKGGERWRTHRRSYRAP